MRACFLSDGESLDEEKENRPTLTTPPRSKRRRVAPLKGCEEEIREVSTPTLHISLKEQEVESLWPPTYLFTVNLTKRFYFSVPGLH